MNSRVLSTIVLLLLISTMVVLPAYADMLVESTISHTKVTNADFNAAYVMSVITLKNVNETVYDPIAEVIRRFRPILTYFMYPNNPVPFLNRLRVYNLPSKVDGPVVWFNPRFETGVNVIVKHNLSETGDIYAGDMFPIFFNMTLEDSERLMKITVEMPDSEIIQLGEAWVGWEDKLVWYPPFLKLMEYPNGTDIYTFNRELFDYVLPSLKEAVSAILKSMTSPTKIYSDKFRFDYWTPASVILSNGTTIANVSSIHVAHDVYPPLTTMSELKSDIKPHQQVTVYTYGDRSSVLILENGTSLFIPPGVAEDRPNPVQPSVVAWSNWTHATLEAHVERGDTLYSISFRVEDGTLWTSVHDYLIWNEEVELLLELEDAIEKMGDALNFEWLKTPLEEWTTRYWNETTICSNGTEVKERTYLGVYNKTDDSYGHFKNYTVDDFTYEILEEKWTRIVCSNGTTFTFNNRTKVEMTTIQTQRHFIIEDGVLVEVKTHNSLYIQHVIPWAYGDPEAFIILPKEASMIKVEGDEMTFTVQRFMPTTPPPYEWTLIIIGIIVTGVIVVTFIIFRKSRGRARALEKR